MGTPVVFDSNGQQIVDSFGRAGWTWVASGVTAIPCIKLAPRQAAIEQVGETANSRSTVHVQLGAITRQTGSRCSSYRHIDQQIKVNTRSSMAMNVAMKTTAEGSQKLQKSDTVTI